MPLDTFICGNCHVTFNDIEQFVVHKQDGCPVVQGEGENPDHSVTYTVQLESPEGLPDGQGFTEGQGHDITTVVFPTDDGSGHERMEIENDDSAQPTVLIVTAAPKNTPVKRKPRGKKVPDPPKVTGRLPLPEKSSDGKYHCLRCKKAFGKDRHYRTHFCPATSDYVEITKKEMKTEVGDDDDHDDIDDSEEYKLPTKAKNPYAKVKKPRAKRIKKDNEATVLKSTEPANDVPQNKPAPVVQDLPIFSSPTEKAAFEESINVDLTGLDDMFRVHLIDQELNENANQATKKATSFFLYSCKTCEKVFKTQSHMRHHCIIHTNMKPFKCGQCSYTCNSKGNLYTHMRKHTGQFYTCQYCDFKSANKSHLLEHEFTHLHDKQKCEICTRQYKTQKSLVNHIRKYHVTKKGKEYLQRFLVGQQSRGLTIIHQCHVCNRKFKKKIDRDRHLFTHDIKDAPSVKHCELCDYSASRKVYLDKHFLKHRVVYQCCECPQRFLSTIRLIDHLTSQHTNEESSEWEILFEKSINASHFLPEPGVEGLSSDKEINLPPELATIDNQTESASAVNILTEEDGSTKVAKETGSGINAKTPGGDSNEESGETTPSTATVSEAMQEEAMDTGEDCELSAPNEAAALTPIETTTLTPNEDTTLTPNEATTLTPNEDTTLTPHEDTTLTPNKDTTLTPNEDTTLTPHEDTTLTPNEDTTLTPNEDTTLTPNEDTTMTPNETSTLTSKDEQASNIDGADASKKKLRMDPPMGNFIKRLGYRKMNMAVFQKIRETFGEEECEFCGRLFFSKSDCEPHLRTHTGDKPFSCEKCEYKGITKENVKRHVEREHDKLQFPCTECDFVSTSRTQMWSHQLKHRGLAPIECPVCKAKFETLKALMAHGRSDHPDSQEIDWHNSQPTVIKSQGKIGRRSHKCPHCDKVFYRASSELQKHMWIHLGIKPFKCHLCSYSCRSKNNLQAHMLRHSSEKPFSCAECGKDYKSKTALVWHTRSHKEGKLFKCDRCPYEGNQRSHLVRHMETHNIIKRYSCKHCDFTSNTLGYMKIHYSRHHQGEEFTAMLSKTTGSLDSQNPGMSQTKVYRCLACDYLFGNLSDIKRHLKERHQVQVDNIYTVDTPEAGVQVKESADIQDVQVIEMENGNATVFSASEQDAGAALQALQSSGTSVSLPQENLDDKTASAVNLLQQIIGLSNQESYGPQEITVESEDGQMMSVNPETIIVQQGEEIVVSSNDLGSEVNQQYFIQYVTPQDLLNAGRISGDPQNIVSHEIIQSQAIDFQDEVVPQEHEQIITQAIIENSCNIDGTSVPENPSELSETTVPGNLTGTTDLDNSEQSHADTSVITAEQIKLNLQDIQSVTNDTPPLNPPTVVEEIVQPEEVSN